MWQARTGSVGCKTSSRHTERYVASFSWVGEDGRDKVFNLLSHFRQSPPKLLVPALTSLYATRADSFRPLLRQPRLSLVGR